MIFLRFGQKIGKFRSPQKSIVFIRSTLCNFIFFLYEMYFCLQKTFPKPNLNWQNEFCEIIRSLLQFVLVVVDGVSNTAARMTRSRMMSEAAGFWTEPCHDIDMSRVLALTSINQVYFNCSRAHYQTFACACGSGLRCQQVAYDGRICCTFWDSLFLLPYSDAKYNSFLAFGLKRN